MRSSIAAAVPSGLAFEDDGSTAISGLANDDMLIRGAIMMRSITGILAAIGLSGSLVAGAAAIRRNDVPERAQAQHYLRVSIARWNIDTYSSDAERIFDEIQTQGVAVFRAQPGFVSYRLMRENDSTTFAVAEWESETLGVAGAEKYRAWMRDAGIMDRITLETHTGQIVANSH